MKYLLSEIAAIVSGTRIGSDLSCSHPLTDSRRLTVRPGAWFIALKGTRHDGHDHLGEVAAAGVTAFLISNADALPEGTSAVLVPDTLIALQSLARYHRNAFQGTVIGITGSVGKTVIKEMAYRALCGHFDIHRSPGSYNSQVGVPLSLLGLEEHHDLALIEAGISQHGEMKRLEEMIRPDIGLFTALTDEHSGGFADMFEKATEKATLFSSSERLIYSADVPEIRTAVTAMLSPGKLIDVGRLESAAVHLVDSYQADQSHRLTYCTGGRSEQLILPHTDPHAPINALLLIALMELMGLGHEVISDRLPRAMQVAPRVEVSHCRWGSSLLTDRSPLGQDTLKLSLDALQHHRQGRPQRLILTADPLSGLRNAERLRRMSEVMALYELTEVFLIGESLAELARTIQGSRHFDTAEDFIAAIGRPELSSTALLLKGAWSPTFLTIRDRLMESGHRTVVTVDMQAMVYNLNAFRARLAPSVELMVMVKAFSYGSGGAEVAQLLAYQGVERLAVAYADEGVALREKGVELPIMVMNWGEEDIENMLDHQLEPEVYSQVGLQLLENALRAHQSLRCTIHFKVDTGMHRLGFTMEEMPKVWARVQKQSRLKVATLFTHLVASDDPAQDGRTKAQLEDFTQLKALLLENGALGVKFHALNTGGILRFPDHQHEMARLGIGLYGHTSVKKEIRLQNVISLHTTISQLRVVPAGDTVGYGGGFVLSEDKTIAVLPIGYADGLSRLLGNGVGSVIVGTKRAPFVGNICMDMCMVDVSGIDCVEGDEVEIFGPRLAVEEIAEQMGTIVYEVLVGISSRVRRRWLE